MIKALPLPTSLTVAAALMGFSCAVAAQTYPTKAVRVIMPFPAGGGTDIIGRAVADELGKQLGQQFLVDNRPGASTVIGAELTARAAPDGYTVMVTSQVTLAMVPNLRSNVPYDPREYEAVSKLATQAYLLVVHPSLPANSVKQLIALARAHPGKIAYGASVGAGGHLSAELFKMNTGTDLLHVPYKGAGPALSDLMGGHISLMFPTMSSVLPLAKSGKLRPLGVTSAKRTSLLPDVPTIAEAGIPGFETTQWAAMVAPRQTPRALVDRLNAAIVASMKTQSARDRLIGQGFDPEYSTPEELRSYIRIEFDRYAKIIKAIGLKES